MHIVLIFLIIVFLKFLLNLFRLIGTKVCYNRFNKKVKNLAQYIPFTESLFSNAGTDKFAYIHTHNTDEYTKLSSLLCDSDQYKHIDSAFNQTIGVYKMRILQCINPFYWIFLPKHIFVSLNFNPPKIILFFVNILYWGLTTTCAYLLEMYLDSRFHDLFQQLLNMLP